MTTAASRISYPATDPSTPSQQGKGAPRDQNAATGFCLGRRPLALPEEERHILTFTLIATPNSSREHGGKDGAHSRKRRLSLWHIDGSRAADDWVIDLDDPCLPASRHHVPVRVDQGLRSRSGGKEECDRFKEAVHRHRIFPILIKALVIYCCQSSAVGLPLQLVLEEVTSTTERGTTSSRVWIQPVDLLGLSHIRSRQGQPPLAACFKDCTPTTLPLDSIHHKLTLLLEAKQQEAAQLQPQGSSCPTPSRSRSSPNVGNLEEEEWQRRLGVPWMALEQESGRLNFHLVEAGSSLTITSVSRATSEGEVAIQCRYGAGRLPSSSLTTQGGAPLSPSWPWTGPTVQADEIRDLADEEVSTSYPYRTSLYVTLQDIEVKLGRPPDKALQLEAFAFIDQGPSVRHDHEGGALAPPVHLGSLQVNSSSAGDGCTCTMAGAGSQHGASDPKDLPPVVSRWRQFNLATASPGAKKEATLVVFVMTSGVAERLEREGRGDPLGWMPDNQDIEALASVPLKNPTGGKSVDHHPLSSHGTYKTALRKPNINDQEVGYVRCHCQVTTSDPSRCANDTLRDLISPHFSDEQVLAALFPLGMDWRALDLSKVILNAIRPMEVTIMAHSLLSRLGCLLQYRVVGQGSQSQQRHPGDDVISVPLCKLLMDMMDLMVAEAVGVNDNLALRLETLVFSCLASEDILALYRMVTALTRTTKTNALAKKPPTESIASSSRWGTLFRLRCFLLAYCIRQTIASRLRATNPRARLPQERKGPHSPPRPPTSIERGDLLPWAEGAVHLLEDLAHRVSLLLSGTSSQKKDLEASPTSSSRSPLPDVIRECLRIVSGLSLLYPSCLLVLPPPEASAHFQSILPKLIRLAISAHSHQAMDCIVSLLIFMLLPVSSSPQTARSKPISPSPEMETSTMQAIMVVAVDFLRESLRPSAVPPFIWALPSFPELLYALAYQASQRAHIASPNRIEGSPSSTALPPPPFAPPGKRLMGAVAIADPSMTRVTNKQAKPGKDAKADVIERSRPGFQLELDLLRLMLCCLQSPRPAGVSAALASSQLLCRHIVNKFCKLTLTASSLEVIEAAVQTLVVAWRAIINQYRADKSTEKGQAILNALQADTCVVKALVWSTTAAQERQALGPSWDVILNLIWLLFEGSSMLSQSRLFDGHMAALVEIRLALAKQVSAATSFCLSCAMRACEPGGDEASEVLNDLDLAPSEAARRILSFCTWAPEDPALEEGSRDALFHLLYSAIRLLVAEEWASLSLPHPSPRPLAPTTHGVLKQWYLLNLLEGFLESTPSEGNATPSSRSSFLLGMVEALRPQFWDRDTDRGCAAGFSKVAAALLQALDKVEESPFILMTSEFPQLVGDKPPGRALPGEVFKTACLKVREQCSALASSLAILLEHRPGSAAPRSQTGVHILLFLAAARDMLVFLWADWVPSSGARVLEAVKQLLVTDESTPACSLTKQAFAGWQKDALPYLVQLMGLQVISEALRLGLPSLSQLGHVVNVRHWIDSQSEVMLKLSESQREGQAGGIGRKLNGLLQAALDLAVAEAAVHRTDWLDGDLNDVKQSVELFQDYIDGPPPDERAEFFYGLHFRNHPWFNTTSNGHGEASSVWMVLKLSSCLAPHNSLALGSGSITRLIGMLTRWKKDVPGTVLLLPDDPFSTSPSDCSPTIQLIPLMSLGGTEVLEQLLTNQNDHEEDMCPSDSYKWHQGLAEVNRQRARNAFNLYGFIHLAPSYDSQGGLPEAGVIHIALPSFTNSGLPLPSLSPAHTALLEAMRLCVPCLEWPTPVVVMPGSRAKIYAMEVVPAAIHTLASSHATLQASIRAFHGRGLHKEEEEEEPVWKSGANVSGCLKALARIDLECQLEQILHRSCSSGFGLLFAQRVLGGDNQVPRPDGDASTDTLSRARQCLGGAVQEALALLRASAENGRDQQVCQWLEGMVTQHA